MNELGYANFETVGMLKNKHQECREHGKKICSLWKIIKSKIECNIS